MDLYGFSTFDSSRRFLKLLDGFRYFWAQFGRSFILLERFLKFADARDLKSSRKENGLFPLSLALPATY
jgi:hypothetical protein